jgi:hypothetical protein
MNLKIREKLKIKRGTSRASNNTYRQLTALFFLIVLSAMPSYASIIDSAIDSYGGLAADSPGVTLVDSPIRAGIKGFRHEIVNTTERSELASARVNREGTYWYGWSVHPASSPAIPTGQFTILTQLFMGNRNADDWPCGGGGHKISIRDSKMAYDLQRSATGGDTIKCDTYPLATFDEVKDKWVDFVMHVKWTINSDGFLYLWMRVGGDSGKWVQKINYTGRTRATTTNGNTEGPRFKMGAYVGNPYHGERVVYTDEYRLGDANSNFEEVAPRTSGSGAKTLIDENCSSLSNFTSIRGGIWGVNSNGQCTLTGAATSGTGPLYNILTHNTSISGDYTITVEGAAPQTTNTWDDFAIVFNYKDVNNYYFVVFNESNNSTTNGIFKVSNGTVTEIKDFSNTTAASSSLYQIKIVRAGSSIKVYRGTTLMGTVTDSTFTSGKVGFGAFNNNATFDSLKVINP